MSIEALDTTLGSSTSVLLDSTALIAFHAAQDAMHAFLTSFPNLQALNVDFHVAHQAANLRAVRNVKTPDALILACGLLAGCEAIVGNDEAWVTRLKPLFPEFRWIYLPSYL